MALLDFMNKAITEAGGGTNVPVVSGTYQAPMSNGEATNNASRQAYMDSGHTYEDIAGAINAQPAPAVPGLDGGDQYGQAFTDSLNKARANVQAQLGAALGEIGRSEAAQQQMVGQLPGQYNQLFDMATGRVNALGTAADQAEANAGIKSRRSGGNALAPFSAGIAAGRAFAQAGVPLLNMGVADTAARRRAQAQMAASDQQAQLEGENRQYLLHQQGQGLDMAKFLYGAQQDRQQTILQQQNRVEDQRRQDAQRAQEYQQQLDLRQADILQKQGVTGPFGITEVTPERGANLVQTAGDAEHLRATKRYGDFVSYLKKAAPASKAELYAAIDEYQKKNKDVNTRAMSVALFDLYGLG